MIGTNALTDVGRFLDVDGVRTFFVEQGDGEAVIMLHGAGPGVCAQVSWQQNLDPLARAGFWTIAYDQPGFGRSGVPADHSLERRIHHARAFIDALGLTHYHLIGSSAGAYVAAQLALEDPRVDRLVLVAGSGLLSSVTEAPSAPPQEPAPTLRSVRALTEETLVRRDLATEDLVQLRFEMSSGPRYQAHLARQAAPQRRSLADRLPTLRPKTLILWGKQDHLSGPDQALQMFSLIPGAELHLFDECGHWVQWDQAQRFNQVVVDFLKAVD
ncbi:MAG: alpha/beta fold hydrolase [Chloroflexota bacterium]